MSNKQHKEQKVADLHHVGGEFSPDLYGKMVTISICQRYHPVFQQVMRFLGVTGNYYLWHTYCYLILQ